MSAQKRIDLGELGEFIRFRIAVYCAAIAAIGYLTSSSQPASIAYPILAGFLGCVGVYSFNNTRDVHEDAINRGRPNRYCTGRYRTITPFLALATGLLAAYSISMPSAVYYACYCLLGIAYSVASYKRVLFLKNAYTGFGIGLIYLTGAAGVGVSATYGFLFFAAFICVASIISDLRDYKGDALTGIKTVPVVFGYSATKNALEITLAFMAAYTITTRYWLMAPFMFAMILGLIKDKARLAHSTSGLSLVALSFSLII